MIYHYQQLPRQQPNRRHGERYLSGVSLPEESETGGQSAAAGTDGRTDRTEIIRSFVSSFAGVGFD